MEQSYDCFIVFASTPRNDKRFRMIYKMGYRYIYGNYDRERETRLRRALINHELILPNLNAPRHVAQLNLMRDILLRISCGSYTAAHVHL